MKNLIIISLSIFMASCSLMQSMSLSEVDWEVMTPELMQEYLLNLENGDAPRRAFYSLSSKEYENLSMDMAEITRYTKDILSIIKYYREYDKPKEEKENE